MEMTPSALLILNAGSSSLKFALYETSGAALASRLRGQIAGIGRTPSFSLSVSGAPADTKRPPDLSAVRTHDAAIRALLEWLDTSGHAGALAGVGHRVVHGGGRFTVPLVIDAPTIDALATFEPLAPHHQPHNVAAIRALVAHRPDLPQVACFDTGFHATMPPVATRLGLPRTLEATGMRRYGFHGLSYEYVVTRLREDGKLPARLIVAHLGNGCSLCAIRDGQSIATTMGFSTLDGVAMATRSGAIDPGVLLHLMREGKSAAEIEDLLYNRSGLLGLSGASADMKTLLASDDDASREAVEFFCYRIRREIGSLAVTLGGLDALAFTGGIGENAAPVRARIAEGLDWLGLELDSDANAAGAADIATRTSRVRAYAVPTDEEQIIARHTARLLNLAA